MPGCDKTQYRVQYADMGGLHRRDKVTHWCSVAAYLGYPSANIELGDGLKQSPPPHDTYPENHPERTCMSFLHTPMDVFIYPTHPRIDVGTDRHGSCWFHKLLPPGPVIDTEVTHAVIDAGEFLRVKLDSICGLLGEDQIG